MVSHPWGRFWLLVTFYNQSYFSSLQLFVPWDGGVNRYLVSSHPYQRTDGPSIHNKNDRPRSLERQRHLLTCFPTWASRGGRGRLWRTTTLTIGATAVSYPRRPPHPGGGQPPPFWPHSRQPKAANKLPCLAFSTNPREAQVYGKISSRGVSR